MKKLFLVSLMVLLAVTSVLGSCGDDETTPTTTSPTTQPTTEPTSQPTSEPTSEPTTQPTTEPTSEPTTGPSGPSGTLRACVSAWIETTDPNLLTDFEFLFWEHLVGIDEDGNFIGELATDWSVSEDGLIWTFNIRKGITFNNGDPLTSADVKFSIDRVQVDGSSSPWKGEYS